MEPFADGLLADAWLFERGRRNLGWFKRNVPVPSSILHFETRQASKIGATNGSNESNASADHLLTKTRKTVTIGSSEIGN